MYLPVYNLVYFTSGTIKKNCQLPNFDTKPLSCWSLYLAKKLLPSQVTQFLKDPIPSVNKRISNYAFAI